MEAIVKVTSQKNPGTERYIILSEIREQAKRFGATPDLRYLADAVQNLRDQRPEFDFAIVYLGPETMKYELDEVLSGETLLHSGDITRY
jgi:hypothetical protein